MAARASDWLNEERAYRELQIAPAHPDAALIPEKVVSAVTYAGEWLGWPLIDQHIDFDTSSRVPATFLGAGMGRYAANLGRVRFPVRVDSVSYWPPDTDDSDPPLPLARADGDGRMVPDIGATRFDPVTRQSALVFVWPRAAGWPVRRRLRIRLVVGVAPAAHPWIADGIVLLLRALYEGAPIMERKPAFERLLEPFQSRF